MKEKVQSQQFLRKRKFLLFAPVMVLPFLTLAFYAMGGGKGVQQQSPSKVTPVGLNLSLPNANVKDDKNADKLSFYENAEKLDKEKEEAIRNDPYFKLDTSGYDEGAAETFELEMLVKNSSGKYKPVIDKGRLNPSPVSSTGTDPNEEKVIRKLRLLEQQLNEPQTSRASDKKIFGEHDALETSDQFNSSVDKLEDMAQMINDRQSNDPEIQQLDGLLNKIIDIQHPERVKEQLKEVSEKNQQQLFVVESVNTQAEVSLIGKIGKDNGKQQIKGTGFFSASKPVDSGNEPGTIRAVVQGTQVLVEKNAIKLRLMDDVFVNGFLIPRNTPVFGIVTLQDDRMMVTINSIQYNYAVLPVQLEVYDLTGLKGLQTDGNGLDEGARQSTMNAMQMMEISSLNSSVSAQAATAGINAAKSLITKKIRPVKVTVKSGHVLLLKNKTNEIRIK